MQSFKDFFLFCESDLEIVNTYLHEPNLTLADISRQLGKSEGEIYRILHQHQIRPNRLGVHHNSVLNLASMGWKVPQIAELTGYTARNVRYIISQNLTE